MNHRMYFLLDVIELINNDSMTFVVVHVRLHLNNLKTF